MTVSSSNPDQKVSATPESPKTEKPKEGPVTPEDIANSPVPVAASPSITRGEAEKKAKNEPPKLVDAIYFDGVGGPLAVENKNGLAKAFGGDIVASYDDGSRYVIPAVVAKTASDAKSAADKNKKDKEEADKKAKEEAEKATK